MANKKKNNNKNDEAVVIPLDLEEEIGAAIGRARSSR